MIDRILSALAALSLAFLVWLYARSRDQEILDNVPVPVVVALAAHQTDQFALEVTGTSQVPVSFTGTPERLRELRRLLQAGEYQVDITLTVPEDRLKESRYLDTVRVTASDLPALPGVSGTIVEGRGTVPVTLHRLAERRVPVRFENDVPEMFSGVQVEPATVLVRGPEEIVNRARVILTQPCGLTALDGFGSRAGENGGEEEEAAATRPALRTPHSKVIAVGPVPLVQELEGRHVQVVPDTVMVYLTRQPRKKVYDLEVPIHFLCPPQFGLRPGFNGDGRDGKVALQVEAPAADGPPPVQAYIDLTRRKFEQGLHHEPLRLQLSNGARVLGEAPRLVPFRLDPPTP